jgi:glycosyltransferase involved in cell wall biosynthesis
VPVSDPDAPLAPGPYPVPAERLEALFVGTGVPLHGVSVILDALARAPETRLTFVGGSDLEREAASSFPSTRLRLLPWTDIGDVHALLAATHVALGIFGAGGKADRVIPFKIAHALAAGRCVVTADTSAARRLLRPGVDCRVVPAGDALALAALLRSLARAQDSLPAIGAEARRSYERTFSVAAAGRRLLEELTIATGLPWRAPVLLPSTSS